MTGVFKAFPLAINMIVRDPINLLLALIPTVVALAVYIGAIAGIVMNADAFGILVQNYIPAQHVGWVGTVLTTIFVIFIFLIMSWTYVIVVGIIASPFNSMLSLRIEAKLLGKATSESQNYTFKQMTFGLAQTLKDEFQKLFFIILLTGLALLLNLFPLFYPLGLFILSLLMAVQFIDYSWSRHDMRFGKCVMDTLRNSIPYAGAGLFFLVLTAIPLVNSIVPSVGTSYFTVLWLERQKKLLAV